MSIVASVKFDDTKQVMAKLASLRRSVGNRIMRKAVRASTREMAKMAKAYAPRGPTGLLKRSQTNKLAKQRGTRTVAGVVGSNAKTQDTKAAFVKSILPQRAGGGGIKVAKPSKYDHLVELGTKPHMIPFKKGGDAVISHPGSQGKHYLQRSAITSSFAAARAFNDKAKAGLLAEAVKQRANEVDDGS